MNYSFKNIYSKAKVAVETDRYVIYQTLKSKLNFSGNYLLMKKEAETIEEVIEPYLLQIGMLERTPRRRSDWRHQKGQSLFYRAKRRSNCGAKV
jgi:hypothetical protein